MRRTPHLLALGTAALLSLPGTSGAQGSSGAATAACPASFRRLPETQLPSELRALVRAIGAADADSFAALFTPDAVVVDTGRTFRGRAAIRTWGENEVLRPGAGYDVFAVSRSGNRITWFLAFRSSPSARADAPRGRSTVVLRGGRIAQWVLGPNPCP